MRTTRSDLDRVQRITVEHGTRSQSELDWRACKGVQALAPSGSWKKIWEEEVPSLSVCLSTHLSYTTEISTLSRIKCERYIFIKCVFVRSLKFVNYVWLCFHLYLYYSNTTFRFIFFFFQIGLIKLKKWFHILLFTTFNARKVHLIKKNILVFVE